MRLHYEVSGAGSPPIVLTHGLAATSALWEDQVAALSAHRRVITWDLRAHGGSESPDGNWTLGDLSGDLSAVLDACDASRAVVLGHSAGGVVAIRFALDHPERTAGLVLVGTASECNTRARDFYEKLASLAEAGRTDSVRKLLGLGAGEPAAFDAGGFAKVARCMGNLHSEPLTPELGTIRCPALIVVGERDFLGAGGSVILHRNIPGSRLEIVPNRGHGLFLEDPAGFNALVAEFLAETAHESARSGTPPA